MAVSTLCLRPQTEPRIVSPVVERTYKREAVSLEKSPGVARPHPNLSRAVLEMNPLRNLPWVPGRAHKRRNPRGRRLDWPIPDAPNDGPEARRLVRPTSVRLRHLGRQQHPAPEISLRITEPYRCGYLPDGLSSHLDFPGSRRDPPPQVAVPHELPGACGIPSSVKHTRAGVSAQVPSE